MQNQENKPGAASLTTVRSLECGWGYNPDWRLEATEQYLVAIAAAKDRGDALQEILWRETDPFVRQGLRFRFLGTCVNQRAISWAFRAVTENPKTGIASRIRAAVIADRFPEEIAEMINVESAAVVAFEKLHWDVRPHLGSDLWLETLVQSVEELKPVTAHAASEAIWLRTALHEGWEGLERLWFRKRSGTDVKSLDALAREIEGIAARRALRHLQQLEETGAPVSDEDLKRFAVLSRRPVAIAGSGKEKDDLKTFYAKLLETAERSMLENFPDSPKTAALKLVLAERGGRSGINENAGTETDEDAGVKGDLGDHQHGTVDKGR